MKDLDHRSSDGDNQDVACEPDIMGQAFDELPC